MTVLESALSAGSGNSSSLANSVLGTGAATGVAASTLTTVLTHVATGTTRVSHISCSGDTNAKFTVLLDTVVIDTKRMTAYELDFYLNIDITIGQILEVKVQHYHTGVLDAIYESTLYGY
jgi:hypothetical protein